MAATPSPRVRYSEIARQLREELAAGQYGTSGRMPSEPALVRRFGVSRPTVARALALLSQEGLLERRAGSGTFAKAPGPSPTAVRLLALLIPDLGNTEIFQLICGELAGLARVHEYGVVWGSSALPKRESDLSLQHAEDLCRQFIQSRVSGVFFAPFELVAGREEANRRIAVLLREAGIPVILLDRDLPRFPERSDFDLVGLDNVAGGFQLAEHLLKLGCRHVHFVARPLSAPTVEARIAGVREALCRRGAPLEPNWVRVGDLDDRTFVRSLVARPLPDAFVCANDHTAAQLLRALHQHKVRVPHDVRVVGFDDVKFATLVSPPLTTVQQPCREIAITAFRAMLDRLADPTLPPCHRAVAPRLVVRDSCGAYRAG